MASMERYSPILDASGNRIRRPRKKLDAQSTQQGYDILRREHETDHWKYAQTNYASSALDTYYVLQRLRRLCRSEFRNNPHLKGLILKMGHEVIGTGPVPEIIPDNITKRTMQAANRVEGYFAEHGCEVQLSLIHISEPTRPY